MATSEADEKAETVEDAKYEKLSYLGQGAFGKVYLNLFFINNLGIFSQGDRD